MHTTKKLTVLLAALTVALVGWVLNVPQLYWMSGALVLLPQVGRLFARLEHRGVGVEREMPHAAHQGESVPVRFRVRNATALPKLNLSIADVLPPGLTRAEEGGVPVHLPPYGEDTVEYALQLRRRGAHVIERAELESEDLLGLYLATSSVLVRSQILVYPRIVSLPAWVLPPQRGGGYAPIESSRRRGEGSGFFGTREYRPGDPLRHVHWRTAARHGRLAVVEWEAEESTEALIAVETLAGSDRELGPGTTLDLAAGLAASLAAATLQAGDSVRLLAPGTTRWRPGLDRGTETLREILESLAWMKAASETSLAAELRQAAGQLSAGTLVCVLTPLADEATVETARYLQAARLRPVVYTLDERPSGEPSPWDPIVAALAGLGIPAVRIRADDDLVSELLR